MCMLSISFFFSSRRRHTRSLRDWSSDVCSSDLAGDLIGGWQLSGILSARSGLPINITVTRRASDMLDGNSRNQRPDLVPGVPIYPAEQTINNWFNPAAFAVPAKGTWGNLGR